MYTDNLNRLFVVAVCEKLSGKQKILREMGRGREREGGGGRTRMRERESVCDAVVLHILY